MYVEITGCERESLWYAENIGAVVEVESCYEKYYRLVENNGSPTPWLRYLILKQDCKVIE